MALNVGYDSYKPVSFFDDNIIVPDLAVIWAGYEEQTKEHYIKWATMLFDNFGWIGYKTDTIKQKLEFPRMYTEYFQKDKYSTLTNETQAYLYNNEGKVPEDVYYAVVRIVEEQISRVANKNLEDLQKAGVGEFSAGSLNFKFTGTNTDIVTPIIKSSKLWYLTRKYWLKPLPFFERA